MGLLKKGDSINHLREKYDEKIIKMSNLLTLKPKIIVCNTDEGSVANGNKYAEKVLEQNKNNEVVLISAEIEQQINDLSDADAKEF